MKYLSRVTVRRSGPFWLTGTVGLVGIKAQEAIQGEESVKCAQLASSFRPPGTQAWTMSHTSCVSGMGSFQVT